MPVFRPKNIETLSFDELIQELQPELITNGLRYSPDILYQKAIASSLIQLAQKGWRTLSAETLQKIANAFCESGDYSDAKKYARLSLHANPSSSTRAKNYFLLGVIAREYERDIKKAYYYFDLSLENCSTVMNDCNSLIVNILRNQGVTALVEKNYLGACGFFEEAMAFARENELSLFVSAPIQNYMGLALTRLAETTEAISQIGLMQQAQLYFRNAKGIYFHITQEKLSVCQDYISHLCHYALALYATKKYHDAKEKWALVLKLRESLQGQQRDRVADVYEHLAKVYEARIDLKNANAHLLKAAKIHETLPNPNFAKATSIRRKIVLNAMYHLRFMGPKPVVETHSVESNLSLKRAFQ